MGRVLEIENLKKSFGSLGVLHDVGFSVDAGDVIAIIGESGSGKSTLLRCLIGLEKVDGGTVRFCEKPYITDGKYVPKKEQREITSAMGMVFQQFNLFPHYTVIENLMKPYEMTAKDAEDAEPRARELLRKVGLLDKADDHPSTLSGGQQQRVAIARALMKNPVLMLFDEPTSALDPRLTGEVLSIMRQLAKDDNMTMLVVTHEMAFAKEAASRVMFMDEGVIVESGEPKQLLENPKNPATIRFLGL